MQPLTREMIRIRTTKRKCNISFPNFTSTPLRARNRGFSHVCRIDQKLNSLTR